MLKSWPPPLFTCRHQQRVLLSLFALPDVLSPRTFVFLQSRQTALARSQSALLIIPFVPYQECPLPRHDPMARDVRAYRRTNHLLRCHGTGELLGSTGKERVELLAESSPLAGTTPIALPSLRPPLLPREGRRGQGRCLVSRLSGQGSKGGKDC